LILDVDEYFNYFITEEIVGSSENQITGMEKMVEKKSPSVLNRTKALQHIYYHISGILLPKCT
jgi:hypothetical protein